MSIKRAQWREGPLNGEARLHVLLAFGTKWRADWDDFRSAATRSTASHMRTIARLNG
jgi:hypothetical protein